MAKISQAWNSLRAGYREHRANMKQAVNEPLTKNDRRAHEQEQDLSLERISSRYSIDKKRINDAARAHAESKA